LLSVIEEVGGGTGGTGGGWSWPWADEARRGGLSSKEEEADGKLKEEVKAKFKQQCRGGKPEEKDEEGIV
jgi:hypothetical protein